MRKIIELKIEETKAVVGGVKVSAPPLVGANPPVTGTPTASMRF
jgi:hypothetical protein